MMMMTREELQEVQKILGYTDADVLYITRAQTDEEAKRRCDAFKERIAKARRQAAKKLHPDVGGDVALMQRVNLVADSIEKIEVARRAVAPRPIGMHVVWRTNFSGGSSTTTSSWNW